MHGAVAEITWGGLAWTALLVLSAIVLSRAQGLGLEQRLLIGCIRTVVQLVAIGYVLSWIIRGQQPAWIAAAVTVQLALAAWTAGSLQSPPLRGARAIALASLAPAYLAVIAVLLLLVIRPQPWWDARIILPLGGMLMGNAMTGVALVLNRFRAEADARREVIIARLALGATWRQAVAAERRSAAQAAMLPTVSALFTVGLVSLPGMMTGQIIAGADPVGAVRYQIVVMFMLAAVVGLASTIALEFVTRRGRFEAAPRRAG